MAEAITKLTISPEDNLMYSVDTLLADTPEAEADAIELINQIVVDKKVIVGGMPNVVISEKGHIFEGKYVPAEGMYVPAEEMSLHLVVLLAVLENGKASFKAYSSIEEMCAAPQTVIPEWDTPLLQHLEGDSQQ